MSADNEFWTPYLNVDGPKNMWDLSYNKIYNREQIDTIAQVKEMLDADDVQMGAMHGEKFIRFTFMLKNTGTEPALIDYEMTLEFDKYKLQDAVRVMWGQSFKSDSGIGTDDSRTETAIYASLSRNERLYGTDINFWRKGDLQNGLPIADELIGKPRTKDDGFIEYVAYPVGSDKTDFSLTNYENNLFLDSKKREEAVEAGYFATTPFYSDEYIFQRQTELAVGDIMYCYVCIWLEGSDFDCIDAKLGGYCKIGLNFVAN